MEANLSERREWMPAYAITLLVVTTVLLGIRLISRFNRLGGRLGLDDAFVFFAWVTTVGHTTMVIYMSLHLGFDRHLLAVPQPLWPVGAKWAFATEFVVMWAGLWVKLSVLLFYRRLVAGTASKRFKIAIWSAIAFTIAYTVIFTGLTAVTCNPVSGYWLQYDLVWMAEHPGGISCKSKEVQYVVACLVGALSVFSDWFSVMLPAVLLLRIRMNKAQKYGLLFIFGLGYSVVAAGIIRTYYLGQALNEIDKSWVTFNAEVASVAELNISIICACAPSLKTVTGRFFREITSLGGSKQTSPSNSGQNGKTGDSYRSGERSNLSNGGRLFNFRKPWTGKEMSSFAEAHEYGMEDYGPVAQGYEEKAVITRFEPATPSPVDDIEAEVGQAVPLGPISPPPKYDGVPVPSATIIIQPKATDTRQTLNRPLPSTGRANTSGLTVSGHELRAPLSPIPSASPSVVFINNEEDDEELVRVRYHSMLGTNTSDDDQIQQELSFPRMNPGATRSQSMRDYRDFGTLPQSLTTAALGVSIGTQTSPRESMNESMTMIQRSKLADETPQEKGSVRRALQAIKAQEGSRIGGESKLVERHYEPDTSRLDSPSNSEYSSDDDVNEARPSARQASVSETAIVGRASLTNIPSPSKSALKASSASNSLPVVPLNSANRVFSPVPSPNPISVPRRPGTAPSEISTANISNPLTDHVRSTSASSSTRQAIGLSTSITQSSAPRSPGVDISDLSRYGPRSFITTGISNSKSGSEARVASPSPALSSGRVSPLFSRGRKPSEGTLLPGSSTMTAATAVQGSSSSAMPGTAVGLQSNNPFLRSEGFGVLPTSYQAQSQYKYRFTPNAEYNSGTEKRRSASADQPRSLNRTWMDDQSTGSSSQSGSGIGKARVRPVAK